MKALRLYDRLGQWRPAVVHAQTGYRTYHASQLNTARLIKSLRRLEVPLPMPALLNATGADAADLVEARMVERRVAAQRDIVANLGPNLAGAQRFRGKSTSPSTQPSQIVLTEQRHVYLDDLPWIRTATARLLRAAERHGGIAMFDLAIMAR